MSAVVAAKSADVSDALARAGCKPKQTRDGVVARCPSCQTPASLALRGEGDGSTVTCSKGCVREEIIGLLMKAGLELGRTHQRPNRSNRSGRERPSEPTAAQANVVCLADVKPERVEWLWPGWIPFGKITLLDGDPGLGKSTLTMTLAALVSKGQPLPSCAELRQPAGVVVVSLEDGLADTIRPRLEAAGADLLRVHALTGVGSELRTPTLPDDLSEIERVVAERGARLVILDPLMAMLGGETDAHKDQHVRRALAPVAAFAERSGVAVVVVRHLNKSGGGQAIYRGGGSIGISGAARSVLLVAKDPDNPEGRVLASVKSNLGRLPKALRFGLVSNKSGSCAVVAWGGTCELTADELVTPPENEDLQNAEMRKSAEHFLRVELAEGPKPAAELQAAGKLEGLSKSTLWRAKKALGIGTRKMALRGPWLWHLPKDATPLAAVNSSTETGVASEGESEEFSGVDSSLEESNGVNSSTDALGTVPLLAEEFTSGGHGVACRCAGDSCQVASP